MSMDMGLADARVVLGRVALARGDVADACAHLAATLDKGLPSAEGDVLAHALLAHGERDAVIAFVEACRRRGHDQPQLAYLLDLPSQTPAPTEWVAARLRPQKL